MTIKIFKFVFALYVFFLSLSLGDILEDITDTQSMFLFRDLYLFTLPLLILVFIFIVFAIESAIKKKNGQEMQISWTDLGITYSTLIFILFVTVTGIFYLYL